MRQIVSPLDGLRSPFGPVSGSAFDPASLFANGEAGDRWTWFRDWCYTRSVGGVYERVTTTGDEIARVVGRYNGINYEQITIAARPIYNEGGGLSWGEFNGTSHGMATPAIDFTGTDKMSVFAAVQSQADAASVILEMGDKYFNKNGAFLVNRLATGAYDFALSTSTNANSGFSNNTTSVRAAPDTAVVSFGKDLAGATEADKSVFSRVNGASDIASTLYSGPSTATAFLNLPLYIGSRAGTSLFFDGRMYDNIVRGAASTPEQITGTEAVQASLAGMSL